MEAADCYDNSTVLEFSKERIIKLLGQESHSIRMEIEDDGEERVNEETKIEG